MKKICFFSGDITRSGGTERVASMIANELAQEGRYEILFLSLTEQAETPFFKLHPNIEHYALGDHWINPGPGYLRILPKLRRFIKHHSIDILIDIDIVLDVLSLPASKGLGTKVISWEHSNYHTEMKSLYRRYILKYAVKRSDHIVTLTEGDKKTYMRQTGRTEHISAIYNPMQEIIYDDAIPKESWLITVGRLVQLKGMDYLAEVALSLLPKHPDWKWLVIGDGEEHTFLEEFIHNHHLEKQLILTGRVEDVNTYLQQAKLYVMTSRTEGLPMCLLEAKAFYLPSVSFDIPTGPNEIIQDGINGYLIEAFDCKAMAEKIERLMENDTLREQFSLHAQDNLAKFQMKNILQNWNNLFEQMLG